MNTTWILVAQGTKARILEAHKEDVILVKDFYHPKTALKASEVNSDKPGRSFESSQASRHAIDPASDHKDHERNVFAKELSEYLHKAHLDHKFSKLIIASSKDLLGELRKVIPESLKKIIIHELDKDLLAQALSDKELVDKICKDLGLVRLS